MLVPRHEPRVLFFQDVHVGVVASHMLRADFEVGVEQAVCHALSRATISPSQRVISPTQSTQFPNRILEMTNSHSPMLNLALSYAEQGYPVFPCARNGKKPCTSNGFKDATRDRDTITAYWTQAPNANIGIHTEGLLVVDIDEGSDWLKSPEKLALLGDGPVVRTPRNGRHFYYKLRDEQKVSCTTSKLAQHVDTRADGGYIIAPGSATTVGRYCSLPDRPLVSREELRHPPAWVIAELEDANRTRSTRLQRHHGDPILEGSRNSELFKLGCQMRRRTESPEHVSQHLHDSNAKYCKPPLPSGEVDQIAASVNKYDDIGAVRTTTESKPLIAVVDGQEHRTVQGVIQCLADADDVYQQHGSLVRLVDDNSSHGVRPVRLDEHGLLPVCTSLATFGKPVHGATAESHRACAPPAKILRAVVKGGVLAGVRELRGIRTSAVARDDGTIIRATGYDAASGLYLTPNAVIPEMKQDPNQDDAVAAANLLSELFADFPFADCIQGVAGCLATILTVVGRRMIGGPTPMFLIDGNQPGCGKTLIADVAAVICGQSKLARKTLPDNDEETRKFITSSLCSGAPMFLLDNLDRKLGGAHFDALLTSVEWQDRMLGGNELRTFEARAVWVATGNNVQLRGDARRRILRIELDSQVEAPEARSDFRHSDLLKHVRENQATLLGAALTMLRATHLADPSVATVDRWGSYEEFSRVVRRALVYAGIGDPCPASARAALRNDADPQQVALGQLLQAWPKHASGAYLLLTARHLVDLIPRSPDLSDAFEELKPGISNHLTSQSIANVLRRYKGRVMNGLRLRDHAERSNGRSWYVEAVGQPSE